MGGEELATRRDHGEGPGMGCNLGVQFRWWHCRRRWFGGQVGSEFGEEKGQGSGESSFEMPDFYYLGLGDAA